MTLTRLCTHCAYPLPPDHKGKRNLHDECRRTEEREKSQRRRTEYEIRVYDSLAWKRARALARRRDGGCTMRHLGNCGGTLSVHHIVPLNQGGNNSLDNLRTVCRIHHEAIESRSFRERRIQPPVDIGETQRRKTQEWPSVG